MFIITGASSGIGQYLFKRLTADGEQVVGTYHTHPPEVSIPENLFPVDISDPRQVAAWADSLKARLDRVVLINCAAINYSAFGHKADLAKWTQVIQVNLIGTFSVIQAFLPTMRAQGYGRIINFSSVVAQTPVPGTSAYAASKAALWGLARSLAVENATKNITINNLNLGYFDIGIIREVPPTIQESIKNRIPSGSFGQPKDIYGAIRFIVETDYLNGTSLDLNAGLV